ncbi:MAG: endonuclease/exonuclease/phosphatase family protein [Deinococcus sp.]|uniref:endonuclease/exonuclease/phosphatase family protein n=1 Tax=Deinococcus sp. TaxID=47478 RepID=UPI0026DCA82B|nr:endonuclease/exonuclease/phosphatase family protein [Deinococcus sp.]MDO4246567.1 endonuclease/exonuclease/phosphatase family protein [Deinococcus sp.]
MSVWLPALFLTLGWAILVRTHSETWWWVSVLDLVPPHLWLLPVLWLTWRAVRQRHWGKVGGLLLCALALVHLGGWVWNKAPLETSAPALRLLTLNADFASAPAARVATLARREGATVVLLQEALNRERAGDTYRREVEAAFPGWHFAQHDELLTLSRWPIEAATPVFFPHSPHALLLTRLKVQRQVVEVYNIHLATNGVLPSASDRRLRRTLRQRVERRLKVRQDFLALTTEQVAHSAGPVVLAGDFNASPRGELAAGLRALGLSDSFAVAGRGFGFTHAARFGHSRIDYVWERGLRVTAVRTLPEPLSDHRAVLVGLALP